MKVIDPGYCYELENFDDKTHTQVVQFIHKEHTAGQPAGSLATVTDGTTNEELLEVLLDRLRYLHKKLPSRDSALAITHAEDCLLRLEHRTRERKQRAVEGTSQP